MKIKETLVPKYFVIPTEIGLNTNLTSGNKILLSIILNLLNEDGVCNLTNLELSEIAGSSEGMIRKRLLSLERNGYITRSFGSKRDIRINKKDENK